MQPDEIRIIRGDDEGRLDRYLAAQFPTWSRTHLQKLIDKRHVLVDDHPVSSNHRLQKGQTVQIYWPKVPAQSPVAAPMDLPFPILFEDDALLVVDKPAGLVVHPSAGHRDGNTLVEMVRPRITGGPWPDEMRPGMVHRLDRDTSGVLVLAKTPEAHAHLSKQFARRQVKKTYLGLVKGAVGVQEGTIECHIARHPEKRQRYAVSGKGGRWASTQFKRLEKYGDVATLLELHPLTGRTHQIRVHVASYNHPILGDAVYGGVSENFDFIKRQMLHASALTIKHPLTGAELKFESPLAEDIHQAIKLIRLKAG